MSAISVVVPTYNYAHLLKEALESVFAQSFKDYEVIVVDDGSTDNTEEVLRPYAGRITYYRQENQGLAVARNTGLRLARGKYVTYLDADDIWYPDNLRIKFEVLSRFPGLGGVFSDFLIFYSGGISHVRGTRELFPFFQRTGHDFKDIFQEAHKVLIEDDRFATLYVGNIFDSLFRGNFILPTTMVFNRALALTVGDFRPHMRTQEDYEYWLRFSKEHNFAYVDEVLVKYRRHPQQLTDHSKIEELLTAVLEIIDVYEDEFCRTGKRTLFRRRKAEILINLAKVYIRHRNKPKALSLLRQAIWLDPGHWSAYLHYSLCIVPYPWLRRIRSLLQ